MTSNARTNAWLVRLGVGVAGVAAMLVGSSCTLDPVHSKAVDDLGPENARLYPVESQYHRPGEPCVLCHSKKGPADTEFVLAGTVFWGPDDYNARADNAYVRVTPAGGVTRCFVTNCNGNFFAKKSDFPENTKFPTYPMLVSVERTDKPGTPGEQRLNKRDMVGHIGREPSCGTCHLQVEHEAVRDYGSPGWVTIFPTQEEFKAKNIPVASCPDGFVQVDKCPEDRL